MTDTTTAVFLTLDQLETITFALENVVLSECCEEHQESAVSMYEPVQIAAARLQNELDDEVRRNGEP
jgi:hypothetical protein